MCVCVCVCVAHIYSQCPQADSQNLQKKKMQNPVQSMLQYTFSSTRTCTYTYKDKYMGGHIYSKVTEYIAKVLNLL